MKEKNANTRKTLGVVLLGNIIDYYDFLLFAHLGYMITPLFIPSTDNKFIHLLSLLLFGLPFLVRPLGGYFFGKLSDLKGRHRTMALSVLWAGMASLGLSVLPAFDTWGAVSATLFVSLRILQGVSLGGEYPAAGTYLMEHYKSSQGLLSGVLVASGTVGSLVAFFMSYIILQKWVPHEFWRIAFFLGSVLSFLSYFLRRHLAKTVPVPTKTTTSPTFACFFTLSIGVLVGVLTWLPMTYSNYYFTKILLLDQEFGLLATFVSLASFVILAPLCGRLADYKNPLIVMMLSSLLIIPLAAYGYDLMIAGELAGQIYLTLAAALFGAPIHIIMNKMFPPQIRGRRVSFFFMLGLGLGGLTPSLAGFALEYAGIVFVPPLVIALMGVMHFFLCLNALYKHKKGLLFEINN